jgi:3,4-dihydroxy 2-butanone 4-phosphate synthase/GTP cyclohydrolase II
VGFAQRHALKIGTIRDLIAYRRRYDHLVEQVSEAPFVSDYGGDWKLLTYRDKTDGSHHRVLQKGRVIEGKPTLCRVHVVSILDDMLGHQGPRKRVLQRAMAEIGREGAGVIVLLSNRPEPIVRATDGHDEMDLRSYGIGAQILADLGVHEIELLSNAHRNIVAIEGYGINVVSERPIPETLD